jgi:hypothetical protein
MSDFFLNYLSSETWTLLRCGRTWKRQIYNNIYGYEGGATNFFKPTTPVVFTQDENKSFLDFVIGICAPT